MKKNWLYILFGGLFVYLIIVLTFASEELKGVKCKGLKVTIKDSVNGSFINQREIKSLVDRGYGDATSHLIGNIDKDSIERLLIRNPAIKIAQVYSSLDGYCHIKVEQRKPVLRVMSNVGYYVDEEGVIMPLSDRYAARVVVATGNISKTFATGVLYPFVKYLKSDELWDSLIEQIVVEQKNEVTLIPKVGNFRIVLGEMCRVEEKMENLRLFLEEGLTRKGWNTYKEVNLKFDGQIVCVKK